MKLVLVLPQLRIPQLGILIKEVGKVVIDQLQLYVQLQTTVMAPAMLDVTCAIILDQNTVKIPKTN